jgi:hypothetical protein
MAANAFAVHGSAQRWAFVDGNVSVAASTGLLGVLAVNELLRRIVQDVMTLAAILRVRSSVPAVEREIEGHRHPQKDARIEPRVTLTAGHRPARSPFSRQAAMATDARVVVGIRQGGGTVDTDNRCERRVEALLTDLVTGSTAFGR